MHEQYDVVVIGAGPAGLAAAHACAAGELKTLLLDEGTSPGGQIYRSVTRSPLADPSVLGGDYYEGYSRASAVLAGDIEYLPGSTAWAVTGGRAVSFSREGISRTVSARRLVLATGAIERPMPIPGWTLPGVMTAGGAQILLKTAAIVPDRPVVIAGGGPLVWLLAAQYLRAGVGIKAILETSRARNWRQVLSTLPGFAMSDYLLKGLKLTREVLRSVRPVRGVKSLRALGKDRLQAVEWIGADGIERRLECEILLLHDGVVPNINLTMAMGLDHEWDEGQQCFRPVTDDVGRTSNPDVFCVGDGAGVNGATHAWASGHQCGLQVLGELRRHTADLDAQLTRARRDVARRERGRRFIDALYPPSNLELPDDVIICRCEEVSAGQVRQAMAAGCTGPNQVKTFLRCGMGPCQGRMCGLTVTRLLGEASGARPAEVGYFRLREPVKPITLGELANMPVSEEQQYAVDRC